jgi:hypothetical protein
VLVEELGDGHRVLAVALQPQRERLEPLGGLPGVERGLLVAEVADPRAMAAYLNACSPNVSAELTPWYAGSSPAISGEFPAWPAHGKESPSTTTPPTAVPDPWSHLVVESRTESAPCPGGRQSAGVANVLSVNSGVSCS